MFSWALWTRASHWQQPDLPAHKCRLLHLCDRHPSTMSSFTSTCIRSDSLASSDSTSGEAQGALTPAGTAGETEGGINVDVPITDLLSNLSPEGVSSPWRLRHTYNYGEESLWRARQTCLCRSCNLCHNCHRVIKQGTQMAVAAPKRVVIYQ